MSRLIRRVACIHTQPFSIYDPGTVFVSRAARGLAEAGAECIFIAQTGDEPEEEVAGKIGLESHVDFEIRLVKGLNVAVGPIRPSWSRPFRKKALSMVKSFGADCVICRDLKMAKALIDDRFPGLVIYETHNIYGLGDDDANAAYFPEQKLAMHRSRRGLENEVFALVDGVITLSEGLRDILYGTRPLSQRILAAGTASNPLPDPPGSAERRHIAYVGSLDPHKGVGGLVRILDKLPERVRLLIFGRDRLAEPIREIARNVGVIDRVDFAGFVYPSQLHKHLARCRAGAVPLVDVFFNRYVSSPMKVFDYLASGVAPVVPDLPVFREIFEDDSSAAFFTPDDAESMAQAITQLFTDDSLYKRKHLAALKLAAEWTWEARGRKILEFASQPAFRSERKPKLTS